MKRAAAAKKVTRVALALTWDGARWPVTSLPPKARAFLAARGFSTPTRGVVARLFAGDQITEMRICWVPRLKGGDSVLADVFPALRGRRITFRVIKTTRFGDVLGVVYWRR